MNDWTGHLKITKAFISGEKEVVFDEKNVITSGMAFGLVHLFSLSGSPSITDFQITYFQLGISGGANLQVPETYSLSSPLSSVLEYIGTNKRGGVGALNTSTLENNTPVQTVLCKIPFSNIQRESENSVRFTFVLDDQSCNNLTRGVGVQVSLNEVGLFMKNPTGFLGGDRSILVAYRNFPPIYKQNRFSLFFEWTLTF